MDGAPKFLYDSKAIAAAPTIGQRIVEQVVVVRGASGFVQRRYG
ncbi:hypothetical protein [Neisseria subflava]|nr:hypothetical protein [Neisseria subflava]